jgi:pimeloyl-ACP methyl ester carboxylesterase
MTDLVQPTIERSRPAEVARSVRTTSSQDGTLIAYECVGAGPALVIVDGAFGSRAFGPNVSLPPLLTDRFTVYHYDRRGRGDSGDTAPYAVRREVEDLESVIDAAGGSAYVYGISSGALLAFAAARAFPHKIRRLAVYEPPCVVDESRNPWPADFLQRLTASIASGRRGAAVKLFMREGSAMPAFLVALTRIMPAWSKLTAVAHTLVYDAHVMGDTGSGRPLPAEVFSVDIPTLVVDGGKSPTWLHHAADAVVTAVPGSERRTLEGQTHFVKPKAIAPALEEFFASELLTPSAYTTSPWEVSIDAGRPAGKETGWVSQSFTSK